MNVEVRLSLASCQILTFGLLVVTGLLWQADRKLCNANFLILQSEELGPEVRDSRSSNLDT
jgi:hypothetical protein